MFCNITEFGAKGDSNTDNTESISSAIKRCADSGGGTLYIPAGTYLTGPISLISNLTIYIESGAKLVFIDDFSAYPPVKTRWSGYECYGFSPLLYGNGLTNVSIIGSGCIDGQGEAWWEVNHLLRKGEEYDHPQTKEIAELNKSITEPKNTNLVEWPSQFLRPPLLQMYDCDSVTLDGITLENSPFWNTHFVYCDNVTIHNVKFKNPWDTPNGDGLDLDSCSNVRVSNCHFDVGDDCLAFKSGINEDGRRVARPTENVAVTNCTMKNGHGGIVMGSENSGGIRNIAVSNCVFIGTDRGIRLKTNRARGSYIRDILIDNIYMDGVLCPLAINSFYRHGLDKSDSLINELSPIEISEKTPEIEYIHISNVTARNCRSAAGFIYGLPEKYVKDIILRHVLIEMTINPDEQGGEPDMVKEPIFMAGEGIYCKYVDGIEFHRVRVETRQGPALHLENVINAELDHLIRKRKHPNTPIVTVNDVTNIRTNQSSREVNEFENI
ncbi:glycoside hydrolase family 28 protein [Oceanobacillus iheyensis]|uniref:Hypothetical conserved protein n=1 Tax=Oceanobacillus iheyensis (strain DSM 14371 / CIP 107618 / JCM 11309 / KCTC 3954 / HTE831) TaxID=221109 RepID=Q8EPL3_OCEIH|nr:glycoside hydrolase family 28 protein [Oceanobacillus iheyensis]BAC14044.1 hypothetical conserved protein [Oceanobacillus iheyensis HTE831]